MRTAECPVTSGVVHPNVLNLYAPDILLKHLLLVPPFVEQQIDVFDINRAPVV
jgi:hypothetical protein